MPRIALSLHIRTVTPAAGLSSSLSPISIAGIVVAGFIAVAVAIWLCVRFHRKRAQRKREENRGTAFLSVRGVVHDGETEKNPPPENFLPVKGADFSRANLTASVVLPDKTLPQDSTDSLPENLPRPFAPFSFALTAPQADPRASILSESAGSRSSYFSPASLFRSSASLDSNRFSVISAASTTSSTGQGRRVRQLFTPVLPDELTLASIGERLTLVQAFDDGWCVVGRQNGALAGMARSLFKAAEPGDDIELGVVPAWVFLKPVKGLRAERPVRNTSLGITVQLERPGFDAREEIKSWSNF